MSYFALLVVYAQKYNKDYGVGTLISLMLPFSLFFMLCWIVLLAIWFYFGLPLGLDGPIHL